MSKLFLCEKRKSDCVLRMAKISIYKGAQLAPDSHWQCNFCGETWSTTCVLTLGGATRLWA